MNNVLNFAKMDILSLKSYKHYFLLLLLIFLLFLEGDIWGITIIAFLFLTSLSPLLFASDEKTDMFRLYSLLPITSKEIVLGRYFSCLVGGLIYVSLVTIVLVVVFFLWGVQWLSLHIILMFVFLTTTSFFLGIAIQYPVFFKKGYIKAGFLAKIPSYLPLLLSILLKEMFGINLFTRMFAVAFPLVLLAFCVSILCLLFSIRLSIRIYENKKG